MMIPSDLPTGLQGYLVTVTVTPATHQTCSGPRRHPREQATHLHGAYPVAEESNGKQKT